MILHYLLIAEVLSIKLTVLEWVMKKMPVKFILYFSVFFSIILEYPNKCTKYYGPHSMGCLETLWNYAHCVSQGAAYPGKISSSELARHDSMNLR